ncbi:hypothetical protein, partial [Paenibacillus odorifer]
NVTFSSRFLVSAPQAIADLLAALEEAQQKVEVAKTTIESFGRITDDMEDEYKLLQIKYGEAQQTIARQQESERAIIYEISEIHKEATAGNSGSLERADTALNRIMLLSSNLLALGNKEGSDPNE